MFQWEFSPSFYINAGELMHENQQRLIFSTENKSNDLCYCLFSCAKDKGSVENIVAINL